MLTIPHYTGAAAGSKYGAGAGTEENTMKQKIPYFKSEQIAEGSWMISNAFTARTPALCYLIEGENYALLIDTMMGWGDLNAYCKTLTDKPVLLANTHAHPDHTGGNFHFDACWLHWRDIPFFQASLGYKKQEVFEQARQAALPEYRDLMEDGGSFADADPIRVYPLRDGDVFDLGGRQIDVVWAGGHTPGSIVLIDRLTRIAYTGDACNGNTLLEFANSLPVSVYMKSLLRLKERQKDFDKCYGGHEIFDSSIVDEAVETVAKVLAGTDAKCRRPGFLGGDTFYAAEKIPDGYERVDGKLFNMSYNPDRIMGDDVLKQVITPEPPRMI